MNKPTIGAGYFQGINSLEEVIENGDIDKRSRRIIQAHIDWLKIMYAGSENARDRGQKGGRPKANEKLKESYSKANEKLTKNKQEQEKEQEKENTPVKTGVQGGNYPSSCAIAAARESGASANLLAAWVLEFPSWKLNGGERREADRVTADPALTGTDWRKAIAAYRQAEFPKDKSFFGFCRDVGKWVNQPDKPADGPRAWTQADIDRMEAERRGGVV